MGNPFKVKGAGKQAKAQIDAANNQASAAQAQAEEIRKAAEAQAAATQAAIEQNRQSSEAQAAQAAANLDVMKQYMNQQGEAQAQTAAETKASMQRMAQDQRDAAAASQQGRELDISRQQAVDKANELQADSNKIKQVDVVLADDKPDAAETDPVTGRRRPTRASFMSNNKGAASGITI